MYIANSNPSRLVNGRPIVVGCRLRVNATQRPYTEVLQRKWMINSILVRNSWSARNTQSKTALLGDNLLHLPLDSEGNDVVTYKCYLYYKLQGQVKLVTGFVKGTFRDQTQNQQGNDGQENEKKVFMRAFPSWSSVPLGFQELSLICLLKTKPSSLFVWSFNSKRLEDVSTLEKGKHYVSGSVVTGMLRLVNITHAHAGRWTCERKNSGSVENERALQSATYHLNVTSKHL